MKVIANENDVSEDQFECNTSDICIDSFIDKKHFWTYEYRYWEDIPKDKKKWN